MFAEIENAIIARLKAASDAGALGYAYRHFDTYPENWDEYLDAKRVEKFPAAWAVFSGFGDAEERDGGGVHVGARFFVVVADRNLRNETATRHGHDGAGGEPGSYQLMTDAIALLAGRTLGLDIDRIEIVSGVQVQSEKMKSLSISAFAIELAIGVTLLGDVDEFGDDAIGDFETFHANWDVRPFVPITEIPDDAAADATDTIILETLP